MNPLFPLTQRRNTSNISALPGVIPSFGKSLAAPLLGLGILFGCAISPAPAATWVNVTSNLAGMPSECGNLCLLSVVPGKDIVIAGIAQKGLWQSTDDGENWTPLGKGAGSDVITNRPLHIEYDPTNPAIFWESGIYNSFGVYQTTDAGMTFHHLGNARHNDYVSVDFSDPKRQTLLAGGHEQKQTLYKSVDGGKTWTNIGLNLPKGTKFSTEPLILDASTYLVNSSGYGGGLTGVYRTTDGGTTWQSVSNLQADGQPLVASDGAIYWELIWNQGLIRSTDQGKTWTRLLGYGVIQGTKIIELPDHKLCAVGPKCIKVSSNKGATWTQLGPPTPNQPAGVVYSPVKQAFYVSHWDCGSKVLADAIMRLDYPVTGN